MPLLGIEIGVADSKCDHFATEAPTQINLA